MRIFGIYKNERFPLEVPEGTTVGKIKDIVREQLSMPDESGNQDKKILTVNYAGTELQDEWIFSHLGMRNGVTIKIAMREEVKPILFIYCAYNQEVVNIYRDIQIVTLTVGGLKSIVTKKTGMPVGVFRLINSSDQEMFNCHMLDRYGVDIGHTVKMVTWDGWNDFLKLATMGYTSHVMSHISTDEPIARYQMKVALHIAAHFGHVDLAGCLLRQGVRSDEPVGEHPTRQWCLVDAHPESLKTPIHIATENGQLGVLRTFVNQNICSVMALDGDGLTPLNIALRNKVKNCASFLLTKQWSRVPISKLQTVPLAIYTRIRQWCDRAKERVFLLQGQGKSSLKRRHLITGPLVSHGVSIDGFSISNMNSKQKSLPIKKKLPAIDTNDEDPETYFRRLQNVSLAHKLRRRASKFKLALGAEKTRVADDLKDRGTPDDRLTGTDSSCDQVKFPPIPSKTKLVSISYEKGDGGSPRTKSKKAFIATGNVSVNSHVHSVSTIPQACSSPISTGKNHDSLGTSGSMSGYDPKSRAGSIAESLKPKPLAKSSKRKNDKSQLLAQGKLYESSLPLPIHNFNDTAHPQFIYPEGNKDEVGLDLAEKTLQLYEKYRGMRAREYAIRCMVIANSFKDRPWLERVRMAVSLNSRAVKHALMRARSVRARSRHTRARRRVKGLKTDI